MPRFTSDLKVKIINDRAELLEDLEFYFEEKGNITYIVVPKGFITDFNSTPRPLQPFFPQLGRYTKASVVHDYLYSKQSGYLKINKKRSDKAFLQAMEIAKVSPKRYLMYLGVRIGGFTKWKKK
jgi:hypothetical protein